jgi:4-diphosphocytidyl-2-C-methyl-D-erythritol kinase
VAGDEASGWRVFTAPAKLNLFLHVTGRRPDGYHTLETVFQLLDWGDRVAIRPRDDGEIVRRGGPPGVAADDDLAVRAARLLKRETGARRGAEIHLEKRIPMGGGLGGGSADAATVLVVLDRLWQTGLGTERLAELGLALGADVPVFVRGRSAFASGIGERLMPMSLGERHYVVIDPGVAVATARVFQAPDLTRDSRPLTIPGLPAGTPLRNDLEPVVRRLHPAVGAAIDWLSAFGPARLTGSGGCGFVEVASSAVAEAVVAQCPRGWRAVAARGVDVSPLGGELERAFGRA